MRRGVDVALYACFIGHASEVEVEPALGHWFLISPCMMCPGKLCGIRNTNSKWITWHTLHVQVTRQATYDSVVEGTVPGTRKGSPSTGRVEHETTTQPLSVFMHPRRKTYLFQKPEMSLPLCTYICPDVPWLPCDRMSRDPNYCHTLKAA